MPRWPALAPAAWRGRGRSAAVPPRAREPCSGSSQNPESPLTVGAVQGQLRGRGRPGRNHLLVWETPLRGQRGSLDGSPGTGFPGTDPRDPQPQTQPGDPLCPGPRPPLSQTLSSAPGPGGLRVSGAPPPSSPGSVLPWTLAQAPCPVTVSQEAGASGSSEAGSRPARGHLVLDSGCAHPSPDPSPCGLCRDHALPLARRVGGAQALAAAGQARSRAEGGKGHKAGHRPGLWGWSHSARAPPFSRATP